MTVISAPTTTAKARGAFYTPSSIADFLARLAIRTPRDRILEPSAGDGAFCHGLDHPIP
jgi:hypothetical protein